MTTPAADPRPPTIEERVTELERARTASNAAGRRLVRNAVIVVVLVTGVASFGAWRAQRAGTDATRAAAGAIATAKAQRAEQINRQVDSCRSTNEFRRLFTEYLTKTSGTTSPDALRSLPGYDELDQATRTYVDSLVAILNTGAADTAKLRAVYVARFPQVDCAALRAKLERDTPGG